jgi:hypothetical protein
MSENHDAQSSSRDGDIGRKIDFSERHFSRGPVSFQSSAYLSACTWQFGFSLAPLPVIPEVSAVATATEAIVLYLVRDSAHPPDAHRRN